VGQRRRWEARFPIGEDTYANPESQHKTQVEPDLFAHGSTVVTAFQTGTD